MVQKGIFSLFLLIPPARRRRRRLQVRSSGMNWTISLGTQWFLCFSPEFTLGMLHRQLCNFVFRTGGWLSRRRNIKRRCRETLQGLCAAQFDNLQRSNFRMTDLLQARTSAQNAQQVPVPTPVRSVLAPCPAAFAKGNALVQAAGAVPWH